MKKNATRSLIRNIASLLSYTHYIVIASLFIVGCTSSGSKEKIVAENDIWGTVTGANGPEAGVWVIAETFDLPTRFAKIVVTDDSGRYLIPELPQAKSLVGEY